MLYISGWDTSWRFDIRLLIHLPTSVSLFTRVTQTMGILTCFSMFLPPARNKHVAEANLTRHQGKGPFIFQPCAVAPVWNAAGRNTSNFKRPAGSSTPCSAPRRWVLLRPLFFLLEQRWAVFMPRPPSVNPLLYYSFILKHIILDPKQIWLISKWIQVCRRYFKLPVRCDIVFSLHRATMHMHLEQGESLGMKPKGQTGLEAGRVSSWLSSITKGRKVRFNNYFVGMRCVFSLLAEPMLIYLAVQPDYWDFRS